jgi:hypothetical protein
VDLVHGVDDSRCHPWLEPLVPFPATVYKVLIASPSDTATSRQAVVAAIVEWNDLNADGYEVVLLPVMWEMSATPAVGGTPQGILNEQIVDDCDMVIAVFWTRLGTPTETAPSGSVEEIRRKADQQAPVLLYFSNQPAVLPTLDPAQVEALQDFRESMEGSALLGEFDTDELLSHTVQRDLTRVIRRLRRDGGAEAGAPASGATGPTGPQGPQGPPGRPASPSTDEILKSYRGVLRGLLAQTRVQFQTAAEESDPEGVRRIVGELAAGLSELVGAVAEISERTAESELSRRLTQLALTADALGRLRMSLDGGMSWNWLIEGTQEVFRDGGGLAESDWSLLAGSPAS